MKLGRILGIEIAVDLSWFILFALVTSTLASGGFPNRLSVDAPAPGTALAALGALLLFVSVLAHELSHSVVGRRLGMTIEGITLFLFGGVARVKDEPSKPSVEFWMTAAGPAMSAFLALAFHASALGARSLGAGQQTVALLGYLSLANAALFVFNMAPAFPLDGGRILRSALWAWKKDALRATRWSANVSKAIALALIITGVIGFVKGSGFGLWEALIGMFLLSASNAANRQAVVRHRLESIPVSSLLPSADEAIPGRLPVNLALDRYFPEGSPNAAIPVEDMGDPKGFLTREDILAVPEARRPWVISLEICRPLTAENSIEEGADAWQALTRMLAGNAPQLLVLKEGRFRGILTRESLMGLL